MIFWIRIDIRERKKSILPLKTDVVILSRAYPNTGKIKIPRDAPGMSDGFAGVGNSLEWKFRAFKLVKKISFTSLLLCHSHPIKSQDVCISNVSMRNQ